MKIRLTGIKENDYNNKTSSVLASFLILLSGFVICSKFGVMGDQGNKSILLAVRKLPETLQQFPFMQGQLRAIKAQAWLIAQRTFLNQALFEASNDLGVHAAMMIFGYLLHTIPHAVW